MEDLTAPYDQDNIFARILRGELPAVRVDEDEMTLAFMDVMPQAEGHVLVIPKSPAINLFSLDAAYHGVLLTATQRVARAVQRGLGCPGVMIAQLNGTAAGQTVYHAHIHVIPRYEGIDLAFHTHEVADTAVLEAVAEKIRGAL